MLINSFFLVFLLSNISEHDFYCDTIVLKNDTFVTCTTISDGKLLEVDNIKNGKWHGLQQEWYKNGQIRSILNFIDGNLLDTTFSFYESGKLKSIGLDNGRWFTLSEKGDTLVVGNKKDGKSIGKRCAWFENGKRNFIFTYNDSGKKDGLSVQWREDGTVQDSIIYRNGEMIEGWYYYDNGKLHYYYKKKDCDQCYSQIFYDPKGKKCGEEKNGNGTYIFYSSDGSSPVRITKVNNEWTSYDDLDPITLKVIDPDSTPEAIKKRIADSIGLKAIDAIKNDNIDSIKSLLKSGFDINTVFREPERFRSNITMLHLAALLNKKKIAMFLMENGADPDIREDQRKWIAAEVAFDHGYDFDFVIIFLEGISMPKFGGITYGATSFMEKVLSADSLRMFQYMVDKGFDPYMIREEDLDVFEIAAIDGSVKCLQYLLSICGVPEYSEKDDHSIYHMAACSDVNGSQTIELLVKSGIMPSLICIRDKHNGYTPYDYAIKKASRCTPGYEAPKKKQYLKTAACLKELEKKYCGKKDMTGER